MRNAIFIFAVISILTIGCKSAGKTTETIEERAPTLSVARTSPASSDALNATIDQISFKEREPDDTNKLINTLIRDYQQKLIQSINTNTFSIVEPYLVPGSSLYNAQKELVANLHSRNIKERFIDTEIYGYYIEKDHYKVEVMERIEVDYPDRGPRDNEYHWYYTITQADGKLLISKLDEWSTYEQDMDKLSGSVKADGYYAEDLIHNYPKMLEDAINTLDITELKEISANETVIGKLKELITEFKRKGNEYSLQVYSVYENWDTLTFVQQVDYQFKDKSGIKQSGSQKLFIQIDEVRVRFQGYAVIGYLQDTMKESTMPESGTVISHQINRIHPTMTEYLITVYGHADSPKSRSNYSANKIEVYNTAENGQLIQEIQFRPTSTWNGRSLGVEFEDMNFDGYLDFRIQEDTPAGPNIPYLYWLWDQKTSRYVSNTSLERITSPEFDPYSQTIHSIIRESAAFTSENTYRFIDGKPILIKMVEREADPEKKVLHITIRELVNQQLTVIGKYEQALNE